MLERIETLNQRLIDRYGRFLDTNHPLYRIVWSEDQLEKRKITHTKDGFQLLTPEIQEVPKYRQWVHNKFILENLHVVPEFSNTDLVEKLSYEPLWVFETEKGEAIAPIWPAVEVIIETQRGNMEGLTKKYADPRDDNAREWHRQEIDKLAAELFGNETDTGDALKYKEGVVVPRNYEKRDS